MRPSDRDSGRHRSEGTAPGRARPPGGRRPDARRETGARAAGRVMGSGRKARGLGTDAVVGADGMSSAPVFSVKQGARRQLSCERGGGPGSLTGQQRSVRGTEEAGTCSGAAGVTPAAGGGGHEGKCSHQPREFLHLLQWPSSGTRRMSSWAAQTRAGACPREQGNQWG